ELNKGETYNIYDATEPQKKKCCIDIKGKSKTGKPKKNIFGFKLHKSQEKNVLHAVDITESSGTELHKNIKKNTSNEACILRIQSSKMFLPTKNNKRYKDISSIENGNQRDIFKPYPPYSEPRYGIYETLMESPKFIKLKENDLGASTNNKPCHDDTASHDVQSFDDVSEYENNCTGFVPMKAKTIENQDFKGIRVGGKLVGEFYGFYKRFISESAEFQVNIDFDTRREIENMFISGCYAHMMDKAHRKVLVLVYENVYKPYIYQKKK
ncbi:hypothetical protein BB558_006636, partial [Smittium angustum]